MMQKEINLYKQQDKTKEQYMGTRCHICTGCGRCFAGGEGMHILTSLKEMQTDDLGYNHGQDRSRQNYGEVQAAGQNNWLAAVDIGTTTIAMVLYDNEGQMHEQFAAVNPQVRYGADVMSRIQEAQNPEVALQMRESVIQVLEEGIRRFNRKTALPLRMVIAANTTMVYLLMGWDTQELGRAPFHASHLEKVTTMIGGVPAIILPGLSAFVGADIMAGIYASGMAESEELTLLIDLGTNGEMVLGNREKMVACATAAGPAFEGGATRGIWGADMVSLTAKLLAEEVVDETGLLVEEYFEEGIRIGDVRITQQAIRELQLAKGAIAAGIQILVKQYGLQGIDSVEHVILAGGFGYFLRGEDAAAIGLLPQELAVKVQAGGNTALAGARAYGQSKFPEKTEQKIKKISKIVQTLNLAEQPEFENIYLEALNLEKW